MAAKQRSENRQRTEMVCMRFTPAERKVITDTAAHLGIGVCQLIRNALAEAMPELDNA